MTTTQAVLILVSGTLVTLLLSLAVKQMSYALTSGSVFDPLRRSLQWGMHKGIWGFETLSELFSCKLCMTMQVSIWSIGIPLVLAELYVGFGRNFLNEFMPVYAAWAFFVLVAFLFSMAISGIALGLWIFLEYPAKRYEDAAYKLQLAEQRVADLTELLRTQGNNQTVTTIPEQNATVSEILSLEEFRNFMLFVNNACKGIGCGFRRRTCRGVAVNDWLATWSAESDARKHMLPTLRKELLARLPEYFRENSQYDDERIESEQAFLRLHAQVTTALAA